MATRSVIAVLRADFYGSLENAQTAAGESGETTKTLFGEKNTIEFTGGTAANQANRVWASEGRVLAAATPETIDVYDFGALDIGGGAGKDQMGGAIALIGIKGLYIKVDPASAGPLFVGGEGTTAAWNSLFPDAPVPDTATLTIPVGGILFLTDPSAAGMAVADTTNHLLQMESTLGCTYDIAIIGIE